MDTELLHFLKKSKMFSSLNHIALKSLLAKCELLRLPKNKILFNQGELTDHLYFVVSGKIASYVMTVQGTEKILREIQPGGLVGEISAVTGEPRSATTKTLEKSVLLSIPGAVYRKLYQKYPSIIYASMNTFITRSRNLIHMLSTDEPSKKHIVILAANKHCDLLPVAEKLLEHTQDFTDVLSFSEFDPSSYADHEGVDLKNYIESLEKDKETILYILKSHNSEFAKICFEKADKLYIVADSDTNPRLSHLALSKINYFNMSHKAKAELILIHANQNILPKFTAKWLKLAHFNLHHHLRIQENKDWERIVRFLRGKAFGLVLGGGGMRSWAHIGALKALLDMGIPIDIVGGTSAGAIVAGYYAMHSSLEDKNGELQALSEISRQAISFRNITWPSASLFDGKAYTQQLKRIFVGIRIENLWTPFFSISCNLSNNKQVISRTGYLWKAIRTSTAVPAIFPPMVVHGELHLDGGILNNLPVDIMRKLIGKNGTLVASELTHQYVDENEYFFPPVLTLGRTLLAKTKLAHKNYKFPRLIDTFLKSLLAGSAAKQAENSANADILITPNLSRFSLLNISKKAEVELIELGFKSAVKAVRQWKRKQKSSTK